MDQISRKITEELTDFLKDKLNKEDFGNLRVKERLNEIGADYVVWSAAYDKPNKSTNVLMLWYYPQKKIIVNVNDEECKIQDVDKVIESFKKGVLAIREKYYS